MTRSVLLAGAALISVSISPLNAEASDAPWCAVISRSDGDVHWDCRYRSIEECRPNVIASNGSRSFCNPSPYYVANPTELRNLRQSSQMGSKTIAKSEKAVAVKKESLRHTNANAHIKVAGSRTAATTPIEPKRAPIRPAPQITTVNSKNVAMVAKPTTAKSRNETEPVEEKANSRTITEPEVTPSAQPSAPPIPVPKTATTAIGGKTESPATDQPSETSDPSLNKTTTAIGGKTEGPASDQPAETSDPALKKARITVAATTQHLSNS